MRHIFTSTSGKTSSAAVFFDPTKDTIHLLHQPGTNASDLEPIMKTVMELGRMVDLEDSSSDVLKARKIAAGYVIGMEDDDDGWPIVYNLDSSRVGIDGESLDRQGSRDVWIWVIWVSGSHQKC
jgi:hypothetical protein